MQTGLRSRSTRSWLVLLLVALVLLLVYLGVTQRSPTFPPITTLDGELYGMVIRDPWYDVGTNPALPDQPNRVAQDRMGAMLAQMGVEWVRLEFHIVGGDPLVEEQVARYDYFIREVAPRYDLKVLGLLGYGLIRGQDPRILGAVTAEHDPIYGAGIDNPKRIWLNRARLIVARYGDAVAAYQVLNEFNRPAPDWQAALPAAQVARLHTTFYRFFHHVDRAAPGDQSWRDTTPIVLGGIQPAGSGQREAFGYLEDTYYLRQLYASAAFRQYHQEYGRFPLDGLGYHPYPIEIAVSLPATPTPTGATAGTQADNRPDPRHDLTLIQQRLDSVRALLTEVGDPAQPFWLTEIGHNAGYGRQDAATQAAFLRLVYTELAERPDVAKIFWFKYEDFPPAVGPAAQKWGTVVIPFTEDAPCPGGACYDAGGRPTLLRPSFWAYRELTGVGTQLPEPPAQVITRGPPAAEVGTELTFSARVERETAARPITYTWTLAAGEQIIRQGTLEDHISFTWQRPAIYTLTIEAGNAGGVVIDRRQLLIGPPGSLGPRGLRKK